MKRSVQGVNDDNRRRFGSKLAPDEVDQLLVLIDEIERDGLEVEGHILYPLGQMPLSPRLDANFNACLALQGTVDYRSPVNPAAAVLPTKCHMHDKVEGPE